MTGQTGKDLSHAHKPNSLAESILQILREVLCAVHNSKHFDLESGLKIRLSSLGATLHKLSCGMSHVRTFVLIICDLRKIRL